MTPSPEPAARTLTARRRRGRFLLLGLGSLAGLLLAEVALRSADAVRAASRLSASQVLDRPVDPLPPGAPARLGQMIRAAQNHDIVYELLPDLDVEFHGVRVTTNRFGFRGPLREHGKPANGYRIVGLGDSVLFGWGVPYEATGLSRLEAKVQAALPGRIVEAVDTGVPGYNTAMQAEVLRDKGLRFAPDLVLVDFVGNDFDLPDYLWESPDPWSLDRCHLFDFARRVLRRRYSDLHGPFVWAPVDAEGNFESDRARVPKAYHHLVGPEAYRRAMAAIVELGRQHGFRVLVSCHLDLAPEAAAACRDLQVPTATVQRRVNAWLRANGHPRYLGSPLSLSADDPHPSAKLHEWWAEAVFEKLEELAWLPR